MYFKPTRQESVAAGIRSSTWCRLPGPSELVHGSTSIPVQRPAALASNDLALYLTQTLCLTQRSLEDEICELLMLKVTIHISAPASSQMAAGCMLTRLSTGARGPGWAGQESSSKPTIVRAIAPAKTLRLCIRINNGVRERPVKVENQGLHS